MFYLNVSCFYFYVLFCWICWAFYSFVSFFFFFILTTILSKISLSIYIFLFLEYSDYFLILPQLQNISYHLHILFLLNMSTISFFYFWHCITTGFLISECSKLSKRNEQGLLNLLSCKTQLLQVCNKLYFSSLWGVLSTNIAQTTINYEYWI